MNRLLAIPLLLLLGVTAQAEEPLKLPRSWTYSAPLITPEVREKAQSHAQKDPTVVYYNGKWHIFMTAKLEGRSVIEYCSFADWEDHYVHGTCR